jgi:hypothetical protein
MNTVALKLVDFFEWYRSKDAVWRQRPWLVLGKGPSFALAKDMDTSQFNTFGLNHVVSELKVDVAHIIDLDVVERCADILLTNARYVVMPWYPHIDNRAGKRSLEELITVNPILGKLAAEGRLLWYNKIGRPPHGSSPPVRVVYFSAEAPYALLGMAGVKTIRSLGIDGGAKYAGNFNGLPTLLANGQTSFDKQFREIARSIMTYNIDASPLNAESPIRVYVAAMEEQMLAVKVLEYSIRKNTSMTTEVIPMHTSGIDVPRPQAPANWPRTPFSFQRFLIPQMAGYRGRAIYLDSDMQVFSDLRELWCYDMGDNQLLSAEPPPEGDRKPQYSVMLLDSGKLQWNIADIVKSLDAGEFSYEELMYNMKIASKQQARISNEWNSLERYTEGRTKLVHYTDMNTQPWVYARHPLGHLWVHDLLEAIDHGFVTREYVLDHVKKGWARPSLAYQIDHKIEDPLLLPSHVLDLDNDYSPPYHKLHRHGARPWTNFTAYLKAVARHVFYSSSAASLLRRIKRRFI